jgi:hypothetical protein
MTTTMPADAEFVAWDDADDAARGFFCFADEYLPLPREHSLQIGIATHASAKLLCKWVDASLPANWSPDWTHFPHESIFRLSDEHWNTDTGSQAVREWLHERHVPYASTVYLFYDSSRVVSLPWKLVVRYWDALAWSVGYAAIATDKTARWACSFHHENVILFGSYDKDRGEP